MAKLFNKVLNFVGWESEEELDENEEINQETKEQASRPQVMYSNQKKQASKVLNLHTASQLKVVVMQPDNFEDAQHISDHLKNKQPVIINLETLEKDGAQRVVDFLSGAVYALDGNIQKVANGIFVVAPNSVNIMGDFKEDLIKTKGVFPWAK